MKKLSVEDPETKSPDLIAGNVEQLKSLFPEAFTEGKVDFEVLKQLLGGAVDEREEKYGLNWHGKRRARQLALTPSNGTLRPSPDESVDWNATQNLIIEGDNLEVLKLLQKSYAGRVKLIYIDPPYNTGKDFIYPDNFQDSIKNYLELTGQVDSNGNKICSNTEASGRFHTDWLNMMYPRLKLARNLLRRDGIVFVSISDIEFGNLRHVCDDVFGEDNCIGVFVWNTEGHTDNQLQIKVNHEYILCYGKTTDAEFESVVDPNTRKESNLWKGVAENSITQNGPGNPVREITLPVGFPCEVDGLQLEADHIPEKFYEEVKMQGYISRDMTRTYNVSYPIKLDSLIVKDGKVTTPCRMVTGWKSYGQLQSFITNDFAPFEDEGESKQFYLSANGVIYYRKTRTSARNILTVLRNMGTTEQMRYELESMGIPFQYPKPKELISYLIRAASKPGDLVADLFAGSCPTAHAALELALTEGPRNFIAVQLPEPCAPGSEALKAGFRNIAEIAKERIRKVGKKIREDNALFAGDLGFRVFKLATSNIREWEPERNDLPKTLQDSAEHLRTDRTEADILFELLLKLGLDLRLPIEEKVIAGKTVNSIGSGTLLVCLASTIVVPDVEPLALGIVLWHKELAPAGETTVVFRDSAFADDVAKTNLAAILEQNGIANIRSL